MRKLKNEEVDKIIKELTDDEYIRLGEYTGTHTKMLVKHNTCKNEYEVTYYHTKKSADFSQSHYDWANMLPDYRYPVRATSEQEDAVALLMNDVGVASFMQYTPNASGT